MRYSTIVLLAGLAGCAYGGPSDSERGRLHDGGFGADAGYEADRDSGPAHPADAGAHHDAGAIASGHDAGAATTGTDAGTVTTGTDAGTVTTGTDAGTVTTGSDAGPSETDAGPPRVDAGPGIPGDTCASALDVSAGGTWMVDTCAARDDVAAGCGVAGTPDVVIHGVAPMTGSTYQIHVGAGWVIQQLDTSCTPMPYSCGAGDWGVSGATFEPYWVWAVERADGACGMVNIAVTRVM